MNSPSSDSSHRFDASSFGLLILRLGAGITMAAAHGWGKLQTLLGGGPHQFPDPFHVGATASLAMATFGEFVCGLAIALGLFTRLSAVPFAITMLVAIFFAHAADPWSAKEHAFLFLIPALTLVFTGGGHYALDRFLPKRAKGRAQ